MTQHPRFTTRPATADDVPRLLAFIHGMAEYEHLTHQVTATEEALLASLFGDPPAAEALLGFADDEPAGFAVYFHTYSTFLARRSMYLEDLYVSPEYRRRGLGTLHPGVARGLRLRIEYRGIPDHGLAQVGVNPACRLVEVPHRLNLGARVLRHLPGRLSREHLPRGNHEPRGSRYHHLGRLQGCRDGEFVLPSLHRWAKAYGSANFFGMWSQSKVTVV